MWVYFDGWGFSCLYNYSNIAKFPLYTRPCTCSLVTYCRNSNKIQKEVVIWSHSTKDITFSFQQALPRDIRSIKKTPYK